MKFTHNVAPGSYTNERHRGIVHFDDKRDGYVLRKWTRASARFNGKGERHGGGMKAARRNIATTNATMAARRRCPYF
ncbi:MAG TPA: hypothetical protein PKA41_13715 [Verrucomicrobiota bacterium]|nr:hypothetical protein [Verrucomicrobiota bacterium]